jgi:hypothetical protein
MVFGCSCSSTKKEGFQTSIPTLEQRAKAVIEAMYATATSSVANSKDMNTVYQIWYSNMVKKGLSTIYINSEVFTDMKQLVVTKQMNVNAVANVIRPYYEKELLSIQNSANVPPFQPVCLNY